MSTFTSFAGNLNANLVQATTPTVSNVDLGLADTEYQVIIPAGTRQFLIKTRSGAALRLAFAVGDTSSNYLEIPKNCYWAQTDINTGGPLSLYVRCSVGTQVLEVLTWV